MDVRGKTVVVTGGASGIGAALARRLAKSGAQVTVADLDGERAREVASVLGCVGRTCDVTREEDIRTLVTDVETEVGPIDIFVSNAGIFEPQKGHAASAPDAVWQRNWSLHVMSHVYAARALLPGMCARGSGYFVNIVSAAGLLNQVGNAAYSASKHAAVSFAESLAITHGSEGIGVSVVCPQYVATPLIGLSEAEATAYAGVLSADEVAEAVLDGVSENRFLILPHKEVRDHAIRRAEDHDRWISGMQRLHEKASELVQDGGVPAYYKLF